jgi:transposase
MLKNKKQYNKLPKKLSLPEFKEYFLPYLSLPKRVIIPNSEKLHRIFNYILYQLDTGCQWEKIPIETNPETGRKEIHPVNVWRWFSRWANDGSLERAFIESVRLLKNKKKRQFRCLNGDGSNSLAKKGATKSVIPAINTKPGKR